MSALIQSQNEWPARVNSMRIKAEQQESRRKKVVSAFPNPPSRTPKLPYWPEGSRGVPNTVLRSALFGATKRGQRAFQNGILKGSLEGIHVIHTGPQLDQADLDVWLQCLHLARNNGLGIEIQFTGYSFLKSIGRDTGKSQHDWLKSSLRRLMTSLVELGDGKKAFAGQLIHKWQRCDVSGNHFIELHPTIIELFGTDTWSQVEIDHRQALKKHPLAQWVHGFYTTHAAPFAYKIETIHRLCGSEAKSINEFKKDLRSALKCISDTAGWKCEIKDNLVLIEKPMKVKRHGIEPPKVTA